MNETATLEFSAEARELGDRIANLNLKQAKEVSDYLKSEYGIEPAAGGAVMMAAPGAGEGGAAAEVKTDFNVVLTSFGEKKLEVIKVVRTLTGASLTDAKKMVEGVPTTLKEAIAKDEAEKIKADLEAAGGTVELK